MKCGGCGNFLDETIGAAPNRWIAERKTCEACGSIERMQANGQTGYGAKYATRDQARQ